ncbi:hypothetical protein [Denitrobaculum tricleocarpae]|uniref:Glycerophosphoryl diester phosphodiesterase membrane domain-containing protein n=1 Tax=Denitrobaculum tricleocarpae TaxID=2591009 RepID=A0A545TKH0_9PROT|nr:hypothetical protein [Denitrobaculum tricleocarpae]TQV77722.1 hypothetical protein FKG95_19345 [Denitrobaculum tricleocarpae]
MYQTSFRLFKALLSYVAIAVVGEILLVIAQEKFPIGSGHIFVSVLIWSYLAFNAHAELLLPKNRDKTADNMRILGFALRTFGIGVIFAIPAVILVFPFIGRLLDAVTWSQVLATWGIIGLALAACFVIVFSLFGSLLPAFVADRARGLGPALARGWRQFFWTASRLIAGPVVTFALAYVVILGGSIYMDPHTDLLNAIYIPNVPMFAILILGYLIQALGTIMVAVVLSNAFLRAGSGEVAQT